MRLYIIEIIARVLFCLSRRRFAALAAVKIRNQCQLLIGRYVGSSSIGYSSCSSANGEILLLDCLASSCDTFVDIGANVGKWTTAFSRRNPTAKGFLVEPSQECIQSLRLKFNSPNYTLYDYALADYIGEANFIEEAGRGETSSLAVCYERSMEAMTMRTVKVMTLDVLFAEHRGPLDFVKIDAEGADYLVVKGAKKLIASKNIKFIQFEYNTNWTSVGASLHVMKELLESSGYTLFLIRDDGLYDFDWSKWGEFFFFSNFLACTKESIESVRPLRRGVF
jgi:FkbM family methyltransferase